MALGVPTLPCLQSSALACWQPAHLCLHWGRQPLPDYFIPCNSLFSDPTPSNQACAKVPRGDVLNFGLPTSSSSKAMEQQLRTHFLCISHQAPAAEQFLLLQPLLDTRTQCLKLCCEREQQLPLVKKLG